jgi:hypothetical protein
MFKVPASKAPEDDCTCICVKTEDKLFEPAA